MHVFHFSVIIIAVNIWSTKIGLWMQNVFTALKLGALSVLVIMGIYFLCAGKLHSFSSLPVEKYYVWILVTVLSEKVLYERIRNYEFMKNGTKKKKKKE